MTSCYSRADARVGAQSRAARLRRRVCGGRRARLPVLEGRAAAAARVSFRHAPGDASRARRPLRSCRRLELDAHGGCQLAPARSRCRCRGCCCFLCAVCICGARRLAHCARSAPALLELERAACVRGMVFHSEIRFELRRV